MNDLTKPRQTGLAPDMLGKLQSGIAQSRSTTVIAGGKPLMRMLKDSNWVYGQRDDAVQQGSIWAINPLSISHGHCAWTNHEGTTKNTLVGEVMAPVFEDKPPRPAPVDGWPFTEQRQFELKCMNGDAEGLETTYKTSSVGGMRACDDLLAALQEKLAEDPRYPCPVVQLLTDSYNHSKWGKTYVPVFDIVDWATMDGVLESETEGEQTQAVAPPPPPPAPAPARGRRAVAEPAQAAAPAPARGRAAPAAPPAPEEPAPTARRRPVRR